MEPLFLKKEQSHKKEAAYRLGRDVKSWEQDIVVKLHEEHPYLPDYNIKVALRKTDENTGAGVGQIVVDDDIRIPVIIKDFKLQPLDLMYYNDELLPITQTSIDNITQDGSFGKVIKPIETGADMGIRSAVQPPHYGKYAYASVLDFSAEEFKTALASAYTAGGLAYDLQDARIFKDAVARYANKVQLEKTAAADKPQLTLLKEGSFAAMRSGGARTVVGSGVICKLASLSDKMHTSVIYLDKSGSYFIGDAVPGVPAQAELTYSEPKGFGCFVVSNGETTVATEPVRVLYKTAESVVVQAGLADRLTIRQNAEFADFTKIGSDVFLSDKWRFVPVTKSVAVGDADTINKLAAAGADIVVRRVGQRYLVEGDTTKVPLLAKLATTPVTRYELQNGFTAYCSPEQVSAILEQADKAIAAKIKVYAPNPVTGDMQEIPKIAKADMHAIIKTAGILTDVIIKQANIEESAAEKTVDVLLGLNFLNKQNIYKMLEGIDDLQAARGVLTRVLLAGRFGLDIDVSTVRTAVFALDTVIKDLRRLRQTHLVE